MSKYFIHIFIFLAVSPALSQESAIEIHRLSSPIVLDGKPFEEAWNEIPPLPMIMYTPVFKGDMTEKTEIRLAYDDNYIYASGRFYDSQPNKIQGNSMIRDVDKGGDFFNFLLDTYNDNETLNGFSINPSSNRMDTEVSNDAEGDWRLFYNMNYDTYWEGKATRDEKGWYAEIRIPFTSLKFETKDGEVRFGLITHRLIGRKNERQIFPEISPDWSAGPLKASQAQTIILKGIQKRKPLYITPYLVGGYQLSYDAYPDATTRQEKFKKEAGLDVKWGISNNANLDLTINTDFAQIEADDQQINLTRFSLFFPEKRQFFQERGGSFGFSTGSNDRLFYSRRIGISDNGNILRMYGGARLTARSNGWELGILDTQIGGKDSIPSENFGVIRIKKKAINKNSFIGGMFTSRIDENGNTKLAYGLDGVFNLYKSNYLTLKGGQSWKTGENYNFGNLSFGYLLLENRNVAGFGYQLELIDYGKNYMPYMGFIARSAVFVARETVHYGFLIQPTMLRLITPYVSHISYYDNTNFGKQTDETELGLRLEAKSSASFTLSGSRSYDRFDTPFYLSNDVVINPGDYTFYYGNANYSMNENAKLRMGVNVNAGRFYNGDRFSVTLSPAWTVSKYLDVGADLLYNHINFHNDTTFNGNLLRLRTTIALNNHLSLNSFIQFNENEKTTGINMKLRYNWKDGNDLYLVFNQGTHDRDLEVPHLESRSILLKYTYTFAKR